jgi:hypothetical protein
MASFLMTWNSEKYPFGEKHDVAQYQTDVLASPSADLSSTRSSRARVESNWHGHKLLRMGLSSTLRSRKKVRR